MPRRLERRSSMKRRSAPILLSPRVKAIIEPIMIPHTPPKAMPSRNKLLRKNVIIVTFSCDSCIYLLQVHHCLGFTPEAFQPVVFPFFGSKDMDDQITKV